MRTLLEHYCLSPCRLPDVCCRFAGTPLIDLYQACIFYGFFDFSASILIADTVDPMSDYRVAILVGTCSLIMFALAVVGYHSGKWVMQAVADRRMAAFEAAGAEAQRVQDRDNGAELADLQRMISEPRMNVMAPQPPSEPRPPASPAPGSDDDPLRSALVGLPLRRPSNHREWGPLPPSAPHTNVVRVAEAREPPAEDVESVEVSDVESDNKVESVVVSSIDSGHTGHAASPVESEGYLGGVLERANSNASDAPGPAHG